MDTIGDIENPSIFAMIVTEFLTGFLLRKSMANSSVALQRSLIERSAKELGRQIHFAMQLD